MTGPVRVGVIGVGAISASYLTNMTQFPDLEVVRLGDIDTDRARARAEEFGVPRSGTAEQVLEDPDVEIVVNLTIPAVHAAITSAAFAAGKHIWTEKPIGISRAEATALVEQSRATGLRLGVAPDTLLGPGMQTVRRIIEEGTIGRPLSAATIMQTAGPQRGHPNPEFLFQPGAGPLFDFGPYYFSALATLFGPISRVSAMGVRSSETRVIGSGPRAGTEFPVDVPTNVSVFAEFEGGSVSQSILSWDAQLQRMGWFEVYGTEGTLRIPDPNTFTGKIQIAHAPEPGGPFNPHYEIDWSPLEETGVVTGRGLGVVDMARSIRAGIAHVASGELGAHVLDALVSIDESIATRAWVDVHSTVAPIPRLADGFDPFALTLGSAS